MRPLHQTRATPDVLLEVGRRTAEAGQPAVADVRRDARERRSPALSGRRPTAATRGRRRRSRAAGGASCRAGCRRRHADCRRQRPAALSTEPQFDGDAQQYPVPFPAVCSSAFLDGSLAHLPWLQEMPDPLTSAMWSSWVEINPATAEQAGHPRRGHRRDRVRARHASRAGGGVARHRAGHRRDAGRAGTPDVHAVRERTRREPDRILAPVTEPETGALAWAATRVQITRVGDPDGRLILFAGGMREHRSRTVTAGARRQR